MMTITRTGFQDGLLRSFESGLHSQLVASPTQYSVKCFNESRKTAAATLITLDDAQQTLRPLFGKGSAQPPAIGDHPDFIHLKGTDDTCFCPITTMFMDIESSTRLSLIYPLQDVRKIKNAFIQTAIQIVRCFDGHVHRIMGDAVMAYFGGPMEKPEDAAINGLNCSAVLQFFAEQIVSPKLKEMGYDHDFGIRIGLDHGAEDDVLWSSYGYPGMDEVTATSFYVDVAAKLQHAAGRNRSMLGGKLLDTLDFPEELTFSKTVIQSGTEITVPFVQPNHTDSDGRPINYKQRGLHAMEYLRCTPLGQFPSNLRPPGPKPLRVFATVFDKQQQHPEGEYQAASRILQKEKWLKFQVSLPYMPRLPYTISCTVENHGREAWEKDPRNGENHSQDHEIRTQRQHENFVHWEHTGYRGLHYLIIEVMTAHGTEFKTRFGVFVE